MRLGVDAGNLDGDIVDVRSFECFEVVLVAVVGFSVAQYDFAQQIYIPPYLLVEAFGEVFRQVWRASSRITLEVSMRRCFFIIGMATKSK